MRTIDLNADLGESFGRWVLGDDAAMLKVVTSANVACGFHAGDPLTLLRTVRAAAESGVVVGAQVGYRDLAGFGRRYIDMEPDELSAEIIYQIGALDALARSVGIRVSYVKPHGALYNTIISDERQAAAVIAAVVAVDRELPVLGLPGSVFLQLAADAGVRTVREAFADRAYTAAGKLVSRRQVGAVLHDAETVAARVLGMVTTGSVVAITGETVALQMDSVCVHGDSPGAVTMARALRTALESTGVAIRSFVADPSGSGERTRRSGVRAVIDQ